MSFIQFQTEAKPTRSIASEVLPEGDKFSSKICFIGEAPAKTELRIGKPFQGEAGTVLNHCLQASGIIRSQNYITNFIKKQVPRGHIKKFVSDQGILTTEGCYWRDVLAEELKGNNFKLLVPLGGPATACITGMGKISKKRGYLTYATDHFNNIPVLPTLHPASCLYGGNYINKYYITHDLQKVKRLLGKETVDTYDSMQEIFPTSLAQVRAMINDMAEAKIFAFDIEVANYEVSHISFASRSDLGYSILFQDESIWTAVEECEIWILIASLLENPDYVKIGQNLIFDNHFLMTHQGIFVRGPIIDTMIGHHLIYPDFLKGLGFLGSIYCHRPYWKDMLGAKTIKKES